MIMKRVLIYFLTAVMFAGFSKWRPDGDADADTGTETAVETEAEEAAGPEEAMEDAEEDVDLSLWDKEISAELSGIPERAFNADYNRCDLISNDGERILISREEQPYLWDLETRYRTFLHLGDEETIHTVRLLVEKALIAKGEEDDLRDNELLSAYLVYYGDPGIASVLKPVFLQSTVPGDYARLTDRYGMAWVLDTKTGAMYCREDEIADSVFDNKLLCYTRIPYADVILTDLETGEEETISFERPYSSEGNSEKYSLIAATWLPDGSIGAILRPYDIDFDNGNECLCAVYNCDGDMELYPLGRLLWNREPDVMMSTDGTRLFVQSRNYASRQHPYLIDRETGEVNILSSYGPEITADPLDDLLDEETGAVIQPEGDSLIILMPCASRKECIAYAMDGTVLLLKPDTLEARYLLGDMESSSMPIPWEFSGNGYNRFLVMLNMDTYIADLIFEEE